MQDTNAGVIIKLEQVRGQVEGRGRAGPCINPMAPAPANAVADATGIRFRDLPLTPERIFGPLVADGGRSRPPE